MTVRKLTERQMRWSLILLQYNFFILYLLSKQNERADALLRQKQNVSMNLSDDRVQHCTTQIIHSEMISKPIQAASMTVADISVSVLVQDQNLFSEITDLKQMWVNAEAEDESYNELCQTICKKQRSFSTVLKVRVFITNASWVMKKSYSLWKTLSVIIRTSLYRTDSVYTWLNNDWTLRKRCNWCSLITTVLLTWDATECLYILLKLWQMSVWTTAEKTADKAFEASTCIKQIWQKIFIDFVVDLLSSEGCMNLLIITDCLSKR
jgi:hypothetical protein